MKRNKKGQFMKGNKNPFWTGKKMSPETKQKMSKSHKGIVFSKQHCLNLSNSKKGQKNPCFGKTYSNEERRRKALCCLGEKSPRWKGGITGEIRRLRNCVETSIWRLSVFTRDNWTCQICGIKSGVGKKVYLHAHHIKPFAKYKDLRFDINNGTTLCKLCHFSNKLHKEVFDGGRECKNN